MFSSIYQWKIKFHTITNNKNNKNRWFKKKFIQYFTKIDSRKMWIENFVNVWKLWENFETSYHNGGMTFYKSHVQDENPIFGNTGMVRSKIKLYKWRSKDRNLAN